MEATGRYTIASEKMLSAVETCAEKSADAFVRMTRSLAPDNVNVLVFNLKEMDKVEGGAGAFLMLQSMFLCAGMLRDAARLNHVIKAGDEDENIFGLFMDVFFMNEEVDEYVTAEWLRQEGNNEQNYSYM